MTDGRHQPLRWERRDRPTERRPRRGDATPRPQASSRSSLPATRGTISASARSARLEARRRRSPLGPCPTHTCLGRSCRSPMRARRRTSSSSRSACRSLSRLRELGAGRSDARRRGLDHGLRRAARRPAALRRPEPGSPRLDPPTQLAAQHDRARLPRPLPADHEGVSRSGLRRRGRDRDGRQPRERGRIACHSISACRAGGFRPRRRLPP